MVVERIAPVQLLDENPYDLPVVSFISAFAAIKHPGFRVENV